jgi:hypothetical protein
MTRVPLTLRAPGMVSRRPVNMVAGRGLERPARGQGVTPGGHVMAAPARTEAAAR